MPRCGDDQEVLGVDEWVKILVCNIPGDSHFEHLEVSVSKKLSRDFPGHFGNHWSMQRLVDCAVGVPPWVLKALLGFLGGRWRRGDLRGPCFSLLLLRNLG